MKLSIGDQTVIVGKRVTVGAVFGSVASILSQVWPEHASIFIESATVVTFFTQVAISHFMGVTTK